jgi:hypothetical protein
MKTQLKSFSDKILDVFSSTPSRKKMTELVENVASPELYDLDRKLAAAETDGTGTIVICLDKLKEALKHDKDEQATAMELKNLYNFALALGKTFTSVFPGGTASMQYQAEGTRVFAQISIQDLMMSFQEANETFQTAVHKFEKLSDSDTELIASIPSLEIGVLQPGRWGKIERERDCYYYYYYNYYYY